MPGPSLNFSARFPLTSTMEVVRPSSFHRGSFPTEVRSMASGACPRAGISMHRSALMRHNFAFCICSGSKRKHLLQLVSGRLAAVFADLKRLRILDLFPALRTVVLHQGVAVVVRITGIASGQSVAHFVAPALAPG